MSLHRATLFALATLFTAGMTSVASAGCCNWGVQAPVAYATSGCGGCSTPTAAIVYAQPVAPAPVVVYAQPVAPAPVPVAVTTWTAGCGCRGRLSYTAAVESTPIAPAPIYVVNQGPEYTGPGIMVPYRTWSPAASYVGPGAYPYVPGYRYGYRHVYRHVYPMRGPRLAYREHFYARPVYRRAMPMWHAYPHHR